MTNTARTAAVPEVFGWSMPYARETRVSRSAMIGNGMRTPSFSSMDRVQARWLWTESTELPSSATPRAVNSSARSVKAMNSVVQTGVKSAGWLNSTSHRPA